MTAGQTKLPSQHQNQQPGIESQMTPRPKSNDGHYKGSGKLHGKVAPITGGDSGIGRAVAIAFAKEGADVAIIYLNEHEDAKETKQLVEQQGRKCFGVKVEKFGKDVPMQRPGQPEEIAPSYVFLASNDSSYFADQILPPNGGEVVNS